MNSLDLDTLKTIEKELTKYEDLTRVEILNMCIDSKLAKTLARYDEQLDLTSRYLVRKSSYKVLKTLTKLKKVNDKDIISQYMEGDE